MDTCEFPLRSNAQLPDTERCAGVFCIFLQLSIAWAEEYLHKSVREFDRRPDFSYFGDGV